MPNDKVIPTQASPPTPVSAAKEASAAITNDPLDTHLKDSCSYSVETAKQFLTFGAGGLAFVAGLALSPDGALSGVYYWAFGLFSSSILLGLLYIMNVVGHINQEKNYDVYTPRLRWLGFLQVLAVLGGVAFLGIIVFYTIKARNTALMVNAASLEVAAAGRTIRYSVPPGAVVIAKVSATGEVDLRIETPRRPASP